MTEQNEKNRIAEITTLVLTGLLLLDIIVFFVGMICDGAGGNGLVYVVYCGIVSLVLLGLYLLCCAGFHFLWKVSFCNNRIIRVCSCIFAALAVGLLSLL